MTKEAKPPRPKKRPPPHSERGKKLAAEEKAKKRQARFDRQNAKIAAKRREPYHPSEAERVLVQIGLASGVSKIYLRGLMKGGEGIGEIQFQEAFAKEIETGTDAMVLKLATRAFQMATGAVKVTDKVSFDAIRFLLETKGGFAKVGGGASATVKVGTAPASDGGATPAAVGAPDPTQVIEVSFRIGDDSRIKDEAG